MLMIVYIKDMILQFVLYISKVNIFLPVSPQRKFLLDKISILMVTWSLMIHSFPLIINPPLPLLNLLNASKRLFSYSKLRNYFFLVFYGSKTFEMQNQNLFNI